jgi:tetratricopeptide (TPR) repeat protein
MAKSPAPFDQGLLLMHLHKGKEYFDQNQLQKAKTELEAAFKLRPQDDKVLNMLGMTYFKLEMLPQAEEMYVALAGNNPDIYTLQSNLGLIRFKLEKLSEAEEALQRALELQPTNPKAHFYLGLLYEKMGKLNEALSHFQQANAEKMITKIQEKIAQEKRKLETLLSFEVLEVLEEREQEAEKTEIFIPEAHPQMVDQNPFAPEEEHTMLLSKESLRNQSGWIERDFTSSLQQVEGEVFPAGQPSKDVISASTDSDEGTMFLTQDEFQNAQNAGAESVETSDLPIDETTAGKFAEPENHPETLVPFGEDERATLEREWVENGFGTGKMRRRDVMEVMDRLEEQEPEVEELLEDLSSVPAVSEENDLSDSSKEFEIIPTVSSVTDSVKESEAVSSSQETDQIPSWEKTDPTLVKFETENIEQAPAQPESIASKEEVTPNSSFNLIDDEQTAADISAFLAQSRSEDSEMQAPPSEDLTDPATVITQNVEEQYSESSTMEGNAPVEFPPSAPLEEVRIPTPEEVENERLESFEESNPLDEPFPQDATEQRDLIEEWQLQSTTEPMQEKQPSDSTQMMSPLEAPAAEYPPANLDQFSRDRFYVQPLIGADRFLLIDPHLLEIIISEKLFCRRGSISSYTGNLHFVPWHSDFEKTIPLIQVDGSGIVFLADKRKEIFMLSLNNETIFVEANHLLVAQAALKVEPYLMERTETGVALSVVKISGRGTLAVTCMTKPLTLNVYQAMPVNIPGDALIVWSGNLKSDFVHDDELRKIMMFSDEEEDVMLLRFSGNGDVVVEQGSLWGDRRAKK